MEKATNHHRLFPVLLAFFWVLSFFFSLPLFPVPEFSFLAACGFVFTACGLALARALTSEGGLSWPRGALLAVAGGFWALVAASAFWSAIPLISIISACVFSLLPAGALLFLAAPAQREQKESLVRVTVLGGGLVMGGMALWALVEYIFFPALLVAGQVRWPFENPNSYAALMMAGFFPALGVMTGTKNLLYAGAGSILAALCLAALVIIGGRGVMLATAGGLLLFLWLSRAHLAKHKRRGTILVLAALAAFLIPALANHGERMQPLARAAAVGADDSSLTDRLALWRAAAHMIEAHPFSGTGIGTFFYYYPQYRLPSDRFSGGYMAHNDPLQFWAEAGALAPLLFYAFLLLAGWRMIRFLRAAPPGDERRLPPAALFCGLAALVAHAHIDFDLYTPSILCLCGALLAFWFEDTGQALSEPVRRLSWPRGWPATSAFAAVLLPLIGVSFLLQGAMVSRYWIDRARILASSDGAGFAAAVNRADRAGFGLNADAYVLAASVPMAMMEDPRAATAQKQKLAAQALSLLASAERRNPRLTAVPYDEAVISQEMGRPYKDLLRQTLVLDPATASARLMLVQALADEGKNREALDLLKAGTVWPVAAAGGGAYAVALNYQLMAQLAEKEKDEAALHQAQAWLEEHVHSFTRSPFAEVPGLPPPASPVAKP